MTELLLQNQSAISPASYEIRDIKSALTPALVIYPELVDANIATTLRLLQHDARRWRPHVKTAKLGFVMRRLVENGVLQFKCSTTLELQVACQSGAEDVLLAYPLAGANTGRLKYLARKYSTKKISVLVDSVEQIQPWAGHSIGVFVDVNPGMNRTGVAQDRTDALLGLARSLREARLDIRGVHYYDGHLGSVPPDERENLAHRGYDRLLEIVQALEEEGISVREVITSGTPAFLSAISHRGLSSGNFAHQVSPGTVVYCDCTSLAQLPPELGYHPAALVVTTVVSRPLPDRITCDAGHKAVSADEGVPTCAVLGRPDLRPLKPSEEHLPIEVAAGSKAPHIGEVLYLVPRHVCPTVNNFDNALLVRDGSIRQVEKVTARGREGPLLGARE
ncbi:MAG TPA: alanine racemase [Acidobacteriota bacterium]|jgi:D-serine deaminase-like pyridoxal phosphate-dependent protein